MARARSLCSGATRTPGRQTSLTYDDEREARAARELIEAAGGRADEAARIAAAVRKPGPTVEAAITEHIDLLTGVGADTRSHYRGQLRSHIAPGLGALPVSAVTYRHVAGWVRAIREKGLSPKTIANVHGLLSAAMTTAVRLGYRAGARPPRRPRSPARPAHGRGNGAGRDRPEGRPGW